MNNNLNNLNVVKETSIVSSTTFKLVLHTIVSSTTFKFVLRIPWRRKDFLKEFLVIILELLFKMASLVKNAAFGRNNGVQAQMRPSAALMASRS